MAVKVTGQFEPAGDFSIVDGKDVSGNITGSNISSSGQIEAASIGTNLASIISGSTPFNAAAVSGSLGPNATLIRSLTATGISGSFTAASSSISTRLTTAESELGNTLISSSAQIASDISGSFTSTSSSLASRLATEEGNVDTLQARDLIAGNGLTGGGTLASDRTFNVVGGTGITANANDIEIDFSDSTLQTTISGSLGSNASLIRTLTSAGISGSLGSNASLIRTLTSAGISGSLGSNATLIRSLTAASISGSLGSNATLIRSLTAASISGSTPFDATAVSGSWRGHLSSSRVTFGGDIYAKGNVIAQNYIVSSSVTHMTQSFSSGSTIFGDSSDDTHQFTGSVDVTGSLLVTNSFEAIQSNNYIKLTPSDGVVMSGNNQGAYIKLGGSNTLNLSGYSKVRIGTGNVGLATERVGVTNTAVEFPTANYKISGSSTSTGSFGHLVVDDAIKVAHGGTGTTSLTSNAILTGNGTSAIQAESDLTFSPGGSLSISTTQDPILILNRTSAGSSAIHFKNSGTTKAYIYSDTSQNLYFGNPTTNPVLKLNADGSSVFAGNVSGSSTSTGSFGAGYIDNKLGIGTLVPTENLHVVGELAVEETSAKSGKIKFRDTDQAVLGQIGIARTTNDIGSNSANLDMVYRLEYNNKFMWNQQNTTRMVLTSTGLGIGTTSPGQKLTVAGNISTGDSNSYYFLNPGSYDGRHTAGLGWNKLQLGNNGFNNIVAGHHTSDSNAYLDFYTDNTTHPTGSIDGKHVMRMNHDGNILVYSGSLILEGNDSGNISGSSTSTGSFGSVETKRMVMSSTAVPKITFNRVGEGSADIFLNSAGTGLIVDSGVPIQLDYTTFLSIEKAGTEVARFTANGGLAFGDSSSTTSVLTIKSDSNSPISFEKSSNRQNYLEFKKTSGNLTQPWLIGVGTDATGTEFRFKNGSTTALTIASGSGNLEIAGNISGSSTSTGSFGHGIIKSGDSQTTLQIANDATDGDPVLNFLAVGSSNWSMGIDDGDSDKFKIAQNNTLASGVKLTIQEGGEVGIGIESPDDLFHVVASDDEGTLGSAGLHANNVAIFQNNYNASRAVYATFIGGTTGYAGFHFGDKNDADRGVLRYDLYAGDGGGGFQFHTEGTQRMEILSGGNIVANTGDIIASAGNISGSSTSTGSFGHLMIDGSAFTAGDISDDLSWNDGTATRISGSSTSTGSFGSLFLHGGNTLKVDPQTNRFLVEGTTGGRGFMVRDIDNNASGSFYQNSSTLRIEAHTGTSVNFLIGGTTYAYVDNDGQMHVSATANAAKPGYTFSTDTNTGMYHAGTDALGLTAGGTERVRVNEHGLGINAIPADDIRLRVGASDNDDGIQLDDQSGNSLFKVFQQTDGVGRMFLRGGGATVFNVTSGADESFINVGRFGVGVTSPEEELDVSGSIQVSGHVTGSSTSTGSFGFVKAVDDVAGKRIVAYSNYGGAGFETSLRENKLLFGYNGDEDAYGEINMGNSYFDFKTNSGAYPLLRVHKSDGTIEAYSGNISGSVTSTGSLGSLYVDNRIGLGITNPQAYDTGVKNPVVIGAGASGGNNAGISVISSTGGYGTLYFGDGTGTAVYRGAVEYNHSDDSLKIWTAGTAGSGRAITIDSSNNTTFGGNIISTKANGVISGSATSTGSFGRVEATTFSGSYIGQMGSRYVHSQTSDSTTWSINHNMGYNYPVVTVYDTNDQMILPETGTATDSDTFTLTFNEAIQGKAVVSIGGIGTNAGANYIFTQGSESTNWRVTHSLSEQYPNVTVYDASNQVIIPESITAASSNETDITFSDAQSGYANFSIGGGIPNISAGNAGKFLKVRVGGQGVEWVPTTTDVSGSMSVSGSIIPDAHNSHDLGSDVKRWRNIYSADLQLSNENTEGNEVDGTTGSWTIQEGEDDLYLLNRKNGKKYKFKLEEIT